MASTTAADTSLFFFFFILWKNLFTLSPHENTQYPFILYHCDTNERIFPPIFYGNDWDRGSGCRLGRCPGSRFCLPA
jgi:hypothetical protein